MLKVHCSASLVDQFYCSARLIDQFHCFASLVDQFHCSARLVMPISLFQIIDEDSLPLFYRMLQQDDVREQSTAARTLWTLSFDKTVQEKIKGYEGLVPTLEKLQEHSDKSVSKNAKGALWIIKEENEQNTSSSK